MADVRLTATNPDDSTVVPVACNEKGELKLEALPDPGVIDGNLSVSGDITTPTNVIVGGNSLSGSATGVRLRAGGDIQLSASAAGNALLQGYITETATPTVDIKANGSADFASGAIKLAADGSATFSNESINLRSDGRIYGAAISGTGVQASLDSYATPPGEFGLSCVAKEGQNNWMFFHGGYEAAIGTGTYIHFRPTFRNKGEGAGMYFGGISRSTTVTDLVMGSVTSNPSYGNATLNESIVFKASGGASFSSDVVVGSRGQQWTIVESGGLAHLVAVTRDSVSTADLVDPEPSYPPLRDIPSELTMVEQQLQKVLEKLRMIPEAGWEVWDGSD